jgi:hypothetical protein
MIWIDEMRILKELWQHIVTSVPSIVEGRHWTCWGPLFHFHFARGQSHNIQLLHRLSHEQQSLELAVATPGVSVSMLRMPHRLRT